MNFQQFSKIHQKPLKFTFSCLLFLWDRIPSIWYSKIPPRFFFTRWDLMVCTRIQQLGSLSTHPCLWVGGVYLHAPLACLSRRLLPTRPPRSQWSSANDPRRSPRPARDLLANESALLLPTPYISRVLFFFFPVKDVFQSDFFLR